MARATHALHSATGSPPPLVGRSAERVLLSEQLAAARSGRGSVVIVGGEAGIGKTTLARDLAARARDGGCVVLAGHCFDMMAAPPYGLWLDVADRYRIAAAPDLPPLPEVLARRALDAVTSQSALFADVAAFLTDLATARPAVLLLEDVHWADPASLELLRYVASRIDHLPLLLLVTYREDELTRQNPFYHQLPALVRESGGLRIDLRRLETDDIGTLVRLHYALPAEDCRRLVAYLEAHAEGNPFFALELLRALEGQAGAGLTRTADGWALAGLDRVVVPPLVRQVIETRIARLGDAVREPLTVASVIGHDVPLELLAAVAATEPAALHAAIETAIEWHLCTASPDGAGIRFVHALTREALYASIPPHHRLELHRRIAETLETRPDIAPDIIAWHYQQALDPRAPAWLIRAGDRAQRAYAWLTARDRFDVAAHLLERVPGTEIEQARLHYRCGRLQRYSNAPAAISCLRTAAHLATSAGDHVLAADATYSQGLVQCFADDWSNGLPTMIAGIEALRSLPDQDTAISRSTAAWMADALPTLELPARVTSAAQPDDSVAIDTNRQRSLVWFLAATGHLADARQLAAELAPPAPDEGPLAIANTGHAAFGTGMAHAAAGDPDSATAAFARARAAYASIDHHACLAFTYLTELLDVAIAYRTDDVAGRKRLTDAAAAEIERSRGAFPSDVDPAIARLVPMALDGRWDAARAIAAACAQPGTYILRRQLTHALAPIAWQTGDAEAAWQEIHAILPDGPDTAPGAAVLLDALPLQLLAAELCLDANDPDSSRRWLEASDRWLTWSGSVTGRAANRLGWACWRRAVGETDRAAAAADEAIAAASRPRQPLPLLRAQRLRGEVALAAGDPAAAETALTAALDLATACALPAERAVTLGALAEARARTDPAAARALAEEALRIAQDLGARPLIARLGPLVERLADAPAPAHPAGLTSREVDVLRLVAGGLTDNEVADRLSISPRTVGQHLRSVYAKLDVRSRTEATRFALEHDLA